jgi:FkbM family methyltransferase
MKSLIARLVLFSPLLWWVAWEAVARVRFLLPHDRSYLALRRFFALRPAGLFLDVGANNGVSALSVRKLAPDYRILSIEPNSLLQPRLADIARQDSKFSFKIMAAGSQRTRMRLSVPVFKTIALHPLAALSEDQARDATRAVFGNRVADRVSMSKIEVDVVPIDELGIAPDVIKIDAEGSELDVLRGAAKTIERSRPFLMVEILWQDAAAIADFLRERDYVLLAYDKERFAPVDRVSTELWGHRNYFAVPRETSAAFA